MRNVSNVTLALIERVSFRVINIVTDRFKSGRDIGVD